ncbi:MAG: hypothetical protein QOE94_1538 [Mycobacterium sp.]|nr:hypothetical protein [Mycobacterium sp.]
MSIAASGDFWLPETPGVMVRGAFKADAGEQPRGAARRRPGRRSTSDAHNS